MNRKKEDLPRCEVCGKVLDNDKECRCGAFHCAYYEAHPELCKECWDEYGYRWKKTLKENNQRRRFAYRGQSLLGI